MENKTTTSFKAHKAHSLIFQIGLCPLWTPEVYPLLHNHIEQKKEEPAVTSLSHQRAYLIWAQDTSQKRRLKSWDSWQWVCGNTTLVYRHFFFSDQPRSLRPTLFFLSSFKSQFLPSLTHPHPNEWMKLPLSRSETLGLCCAQKSRCRIKMQILRRDTQRWCFGGSRMGLRNLPFWQTLPAGA